MESRVTLNSHNLTPERIELLWRQLIHPVDQWGHEGTRVDRYNSKTLNAEQVKAIKPSGAFPPRGKLFLSREPVSTGARPVITKGSRVASLGGCAYAIAAAHSGLDISKGTTSHIVDFGVMLTEQDCNANNIGIEPMNVNKDRDNCHRSFLRGTTITSSS